MICPAWSESRPFFTTDHDDQAVAPKVGDTTEVPISVDSSEYAS